MKISEEKNGEIVVIGLSGRLDATTHRDLEARLLDLIESGERQFLFDLASLEYISSAGLRVFLMGAKKTKGKGKLVLCSLQEQVLEVFDIAGFTSFFPIFPTKEEGAASFS